MTFSRKIFRTPLKRSVLFVKSGDAPSLLVDETADTLDTTTACETTDSGLGDTLDVVAQDLQRSGDEEGGGWTDLAVALGSTLAETLAALSTTRHVVRVS